MVLLEWTRRALKCNYIHYHSHISTGPTSAGEEIDPLLYLLPLGFFIAKRSSRGVRHMESLISIFLSLLNVGVDFGIIWCNLSKGWWGALGGWKMEMGRFWWWTSVWDLINVTSRSDNQQTAAPVAGMQSMTAKNQDKTLIWLRSFCCMALATIASATGPDLMHFPLPQAKLKKSFLSGRSWRNQLSVWNWMLYSVLCFITFSGIAIFGYSERQYGNIAWSFLCLLSRKPLLVPLCQ